MSVGSQGRTPCPGEAHLEAYVRGETSDPAIDQHAESCSACRAAITEIRTNEAFLTNFAPAIAAPSEPTTGDLLPRESIPGFRIVGEIHRGGQGVVYRAFDLRAKRDVAIKMLLHGVFASPRQRARFEREIEIAARLKHSNIVTLYETSLLPGRRLGYIMEYIDGLPLDEAVRRLWPPDGDTADGSHEAIRGKLDLFRKICDALRYAHEHGVIHRDLKPGNILVDDAGEPHILDFGLAKGISDAAFGDAATITRTGEIFGTLAYAAPEQVTGEAETLDTRADVYALGVLLYEMLTGQLPYELAGSVQQIVATVVRTQPRSPGTLCRGIDGELETILLTCLAKEPRRRYASAGAIDRDLDRYLRGDAIDAKRTSNWYMLRKAARRHRRVVVAAGVLMGLLAVFSIGMTALARKLTLERDRTASMLSASNVEQGRMHARAGNVIAAEHRLWDELIEQMETSERPLEEQLGQDAAVRHAYWGLWELYADQPCLLTIAAADVAVRRVDVRVGGDLLATGSDDGIVRLFTLPRGDLVAAWPVSQESNVRIRFAPDGRVLAAGTGDGSVVLFDVERRERLDTLQSVSASEITALGFSSRGDRLAVGNDDGMVTTWDVGARQVLRVLHEHDRAIRDFAFAAEDSLLGAIDSHHAVVWDRDGTVVTDRRFDTNLVSLLQLDRDDGLVAGWQGYFLFDVRRLSDGSGWQQQGHLGKLDGCDADAGGRWIASASRDATIWLWHRDGNGLEPATVLRGHRDNVMDVRFVPEQRVLVSGCRDGTVKVWEPDARGCDRAFPDPEPSVHAIAVGPREEQIATAGNDGTIHLRTASTGDVTRTMRGHEGVAAALAFVGDGTQLASGGYDGTLRVWDAATGRCVRTWAAHEGEIHGIDVSPDGTWLASAGLDRTIRVWSVADGSLRAELPGHGERIPCVRFAPDGHTLVSSDAAGSVRVWDLADADPGRSALPLRPRGSSARAIAIGPSGRLAVGTDIGSVELYDIYSRERLGVLEGHGAHVFVVAFSPDGNLLASGARDGTVKLWDAAAQRELAVLRHSGGSKMIFDLAFGKTDRRLYVGGSGGLLGVLDLSYYDRHIAGNVACQLRRLDADAPALERWARRTLESDADR